MDEAGNRHVGVFTAGVSHFGGVFPRFLDAGDDLTADGAVGIGGVDEVEVVRRDGHGQLVAREDDASALLFRQDEVLFELRKVGDTVLELPGVGVPLFLSDSRVFPIAEARAGEGFFRKVGGWAGTGEGGGLFGQGPDGVEAVQQERVRHEVRVLRSRRVNGDLAICQLNGDWTHQGR